MLKKIIVSVILIIKVWFAFSQNGYQMLWNHNLKISNVKPYSYSKKNNLNNFLESLKDNDQRTRENENSDSVKSKLRYFDSLNFLKYNSYFLKQGYMSFTKERLKSDQYDVERLLLTNYVLNLHFSDRFGINLINLISESIHKGSCDESDLMNYFVTYLWRNVEFSEYKYLGIPFHVVLLPNLENGPYSEYFNYAYNRFLANSLEEDSSFLYATISNVNISGNQFDWVKSKIKGAMHPYLLNILNTVITNLKNGIVAIIKEANALGIPNGNYSILLSTHPKYKYNPFYVY